MASMTPSADGINDWVTGRAPRNPNAAAQRRVTLADLGSKLSAVRAAVESMEPGPLAVALSGALDAAAASLRDLPKPNFDSEVKFISDVINSCERAQQ